MSHTEYDSMWLQKSLTLPDPLPDITGTTPEVASHGEARHRQEEEPAAEEGDGEKGTTAPAEPPATADHTSPNPPSPSDASQRGGETELTQMLLGGPSGLAVGAGVQRASTGRYSCPRMSLSSVAFISAREYDDLRAKYSQARRELLKVSDVQRDLDFTRFELTRAQEELKMLSQSNQMLRQDLNEAVERADRAAKAKAQLASEREEESLSQRKEVERLRALIEELRQSNSSRLADLVEQQESEAQMRVEAMRDELAAFAAQVQSMAEQMDELRREARGYETARDGAVDELRSLKNSLQDRDSKLAEAKEQLREAQESHQRFVDEIAKDREEALRSMQALSDRRVEQVTRSKDACMTELKEELQEAKDRCRTLAEESAVLRNTNQQLTEAVKQTACDHAKELRHLAEEHRLALYERDQQMEMKLREAKGNRFGVEEECQSLRKQLVKASEELSTVAAVLVQRERQLSEAERDRAHLKERLSALEQDNAQLASDAAVHEAAVEEAKERIHHLHQQKDTLEEGYSSDLRSAKERIRQLEALLMNTNAELSSVRQQQAKASEDDRAIRKRLREELEAMTEERNRLASSLNGAVANTESNAEEYRKRYAAEKQKTDALSAELASAVSRCSTLEKRLDDELRRAISRAVTMAPLSTRASPVPSAVRLRSGSAANAHLGASSAREGSSMKRARTEDARVFAITGFDGGELLSSIKQLPNVAIAECKSNMPVPSNLTHLVTNGQLTMKLLTALVRGCWVLPEAYVIECLKQQTWLPESQFGFQHEQPPLLKKRFLVTDAFSACKHYSTAAVLLREGGAIVDEVSSADDADWVLCTNQEVAAFEGKGMSWERMVGLIYPVHVS